MDDWTGRGPASPVEDDALAGATADRLWTRRSALALTAGFLGLGLAAPAHARRAMPRATQIVVSKKNRVLALMNGEQTLKKYRIHLGFTPLGHKERSGDGRTPEGVYYIDRRNPLSSYYLSLGISYPNPNDVARGRALGLDPGGDIMIHGGPTLRADRYKKDWTAGCIAVSDTEIEEIWSMVPTGIPIVILA
ncbi:L,D-transpeptidase family protein [Amaricoccus sp. W119]|uniref:L,D-transpeptidase family protein n=1 Tax=Amaricoccus sp. W119 TaxID=3391833 RepID=UPI0039A6D99E